MPTFIQQRNRQNQKALLASRPMFTHSRNVVTGASGAWERTDIVQTYTRMKSIIIL